MFEHMHCLGWFFFFFKLRIYTRYFFVLYLMDTHIFILPGGISIHTIQIKLFLLLTWRALSLSNCMTCLHYSSPLIGIVSEHCSTALVAESLQNAALLQFQRPWNMATTSSLLSIKISCKCRRAILTRILPLIHAGVPRRDMN